MRKTKIICTIGPACRDEETITKMIDAGMNVARLNFSHADHAHHKETIDMLKAIRKKLEIPLAILLDTKGPEVRVKSFKDGKCELVDNQKFTLTTREVEGTSEIVSVNFDKFATSLVAGNIILIDDGKIGLVVDEVSDTDVVCTVTHGGMISDRKSINVPNVHLDFPHLSDTDKADILFGIEEDVDFVAASFIRDASDVQTIRKYLNYNGGHAIKIISKIENMEGIDNFDEILEHSDGIMVARGDMGVEIEFERLPGIQKRFIKKCYQAGKIVITATQMLESMISNPSPTRAEITDVANAVFDGTSAVMLSGETAAGKYPVKACLAMAKIARQAQQDAFEMEVFKKIPTPIDAFDISNAVCDAACRAANDIAAKAIIALTKSGQTARGMSKYRPDQVIVATTPDVKTYNQLAMSWGVYPVMARYIDDQNKLLQHAVDCAKQIDMVENGDNVVIAAGVPIGAQGGTNMIKVEVVK
ncbi:MAG: pyruvate kinase [Clostridia bacterium]